MLPRLYLPPLFSPKGVIRLKSPPIIHEKSPTFPFIWLSNSINGGFWETILGPLILVRVTFSSESRIMKFADREKWVTHQSIRKIEFECQRIAIHPVGLVAYTSIILHPFKILCPTLLIFSFLHFFS